MNTYGTLAADKEGSTAGTPREQLPRFMPRITSASFKPEVNAKIDELGTLEPSYSFRNDDDGKKKAVGAYWKRLEQFFSAKDELKETTRKAEPPSTHPSKKKSKAKVPDPESDGSISDHEPNSGDDVN